jgi:hypothetical protein
MRTKALILTAAVGALSVASSMAQVYSVNAVGYINVTVPAGQLKMVANQLISSSTNVSQAIPTAPSGTQVFSLNSDGTFRIGQYNVIIPGTLEFWDDPEVPLPLGGGLFVSVPSGGSPLNITFVGEVPQGTLNNLVPSGLSMKSSMVPQSGLITANLNYQPTANDTCYQYDGGTGNFIIGQYNVIIPGTLEFWDNEPNIAVGEAFYLLTSTQKTWTRTFTVN